tara:strand:+ start:399 stop:674 length:276 start_codon:yes stop_codon:yes gene_type:complete
MKLKQLTRLIKEELKNLTTENHAGYLREKADPEWWMNCGNGEGCMGTINFNDQSVDAACCAALIHPGSNEMDSRSNNLPRTNPMNPNTKGY